MSFVRYVKNGLIYRINKVADLFLIPMYRKSIEKKVRLMRLKDIIKVAFVVPELGVWKTEGLYIEMNKHKRFNPIIVIVPSTEVPEGADIVKEYVNQKGYNFIDVREVDKWAMHDMNIDIIFYQKPYDYSLPNCYNFRKFPKSLFCYVNYAFHTINLRDVCETPLINAAWQVYYENKATCQNAESIMMHPCGNGVVTGLPMSDDLMLPLANYDNPWKENKGKNRLKRIIWAPHHSIGDSEHNGIDYSTFLDYSEFMLEMAIKYKDKIQIAFKPHPLLKKNLLSYWDENKINTYYQVWNNLENAQLELGGYKGLFMHSDAMIHDCGSFTVEYHYTQHPVMYLVKNDEHTVNLNEFAIKAYELHYKGYSRKDIERFICDVIIGNDPLAKERMAFFCDYLQPPCGKTATQNIIAAIIGA